MLFETSLTSDGWDISKNVFLSSCCVSGWLEQEEPGGKASGEPKWCDIGAETPSCPVCLSKTRRQAKAGELLAVKTLFLHLYTCQYDSVNQAMLLLR